MTAPERGLKSIGQVLPLVLQKFGITDNGLAVGNNAAISGTSRKDIENVLDSLAGYALSRYLDINENNRSSLSPDNFSLGSASLEWQAEFAKACPKDEYGQKDYILDARIEVVRFAHQVTNEQAQALAEILLYRGPDEQIESTQVQNEKFWAREVLAVLNDNDLARQALRMCDLIQEMNRPLTFEAASGRMSETIQELTKQPIFWKAALSSMLFGEVAAFNRVFVIEQLKEHKDLVAPQLSQYLKAIADLLKSDIQIEILKWLAAPPSTYVGNQALDKIFGGADIEWDDVENP